MPARGVGGGRCGQPRGSRSADRDACARHLGRLAPGDLIVVVATRHAGWSVHDRAAHHRVHPSPRLLVSPAGRDPSSSGQLSVLSIHRLSPGGEEYYLSLAAGAADEYYPTEGPGQWFGAGAEAVGLSGPASGDYLRAILAGADPRRGAPLADAIGLDADTLTGITHQIERRQLRDADQLAETLLGPAGLTAHRSAADRRAVLRAVSREAPAGLRRDELQTLADKVLADRRVITLTHPTPGLPAGDDEHVATTVEVIGLEAALIDSADRRQDAGVAVVVHPARVSVEDTTRLSDEQRAMVTELLGSGRGVEIVDRPTRALRAARRRGSCYRPALGALRRWASRSMTSRLAMTSRPSWCRRPWHMRSSSARWRRRTRVI
mgnify:CR=1 FL=1